MDRQKLRESIRELGPWHQDIQITEDISSGDLFDERGRLEQLENEHVALVKLEEAFKKPLERIFPQGLNGKRVLDCACNAGGYSFWSREMGAEFCFGFDVREHWIRQALFVQKHRTVGPTDKILFSVNDIYEIGQKQLPRFHFTVFKGIFYHLPDPIHALKIAADLTSEVMMFNTQTAWGTPDDNLQVTLEKIDRPMSGIHGLSWRPSGPGVMAPIFAWLGFKSLRMVYHTRYPDKPELGRMSLFAARDPERLNFMHSRPELITPNLLKMSGA